MNKSEIKLIIKWRPSPPKISERVKLNTPSLI